MSLHHAHVKRGLQAEGSDKGQFMPKKKAEEQSQVWMETMMGSVDNQEPTKDNQMPAPTIPSSSHA